MLRGGGAHGEEGDPCAREQTVANWSEGGSRYEHLSKGRSQSSGARNFCATAIERVEITQVNCQGDGSESAQLRWRTRW